MIIIASKEEKELLERLRSFERGETDRVAGYVKDVSNLRAEIETLKIEKGRKQEEHAKEERELRHMIGLEKKRQEFEIEQARKETSLKVREDNLAAEKARFEEHLKFNTDRFTSMEKYLKEMMEKVLDRLPNVNVEMKRGGRAA
jgi:hypothetical protein